MRQLPPGERLGGGRAAYLVFVWVASFVGSGITFGVVMSMMGRVAPWIALHAIGGFVVALGLPFLLLEGLLRRLQVPRAGVTAELFALFSVAVASLFLVGGASFTRRSLRLEGEKLYDLGYVSAAKPFFTFAGVRLVEVPPVEPIVPTVDERSVDASAPVVDASVAETSVSAVDAGNVAEDAEDVKPEAGKFDGGKKVAAPARAPKKSLDEASKLASVSLGRVLVRKGPRTRAASAVLVDSSGLWIATDVGFEGAEDVQLEARGEVVRNVAWLGTRDGGGVALLRADSLGAQPLKLSPEAITKTALSVAYLVPTNTKSPLWFEAMVQLVDERVVAKVDEGVSSLLSASGGFLVDGRGELLGAVSTREKQGDFVEVVNAADVRELLHFSDVKRRWP